MLKNKWNELELNRIYLVKLDVGAVYVALVQKYSSHSYGSAIIFSYSSFAQNPIYVQLKDNVWTETSLITNSDLGIVYHPNITIPSTKAAIENYIKTNTGTLNRFNTVRSNPAPGSEAGFFGSRGSFSILWQCSSTAYGWITIYSDTVEKPIIYGILSSNTFTWSIPTLTQI